MRRITLLILFALAILSGMMWGNAAEPPLALVSLTTEQDNQNTPASLAVPVRQATPHRYIWFPTMPRSIGEWAATEEPLSQVALSNLGNPPVNEYFYENIFGEQVNTQMIAAITSAAYIEPSICVPGNGFEKTATKIIYPFGANLPVYALVLKNLSNNNRIVIYYWVQHRDGSTSVPDARSLQQEFTVADRDKPVQPEPECIVRASTGIHPADPLGLQARRNLEAVCRGLYAALKRSNHTQATDAPLTDPLAAATDAAKFRSILAQYATTTEGGPDIAYLTTPTTTSQTPNHASDNLLPLTVGNFWQMRSKSGSKVSRDKLTVVRTVTPPGGGASIEIDISREGAPWRKELYSNDKNTGIYLIAVKDETSPMIVFNKPLPLLRYGFKEGDEWNWQGSARVEGKGNYSATAVSRVSDVESLTTPAGTFRAFRIDTIFTLQDNGRRIRFPSARWLAPHVGFVRRAYADKGQPATSEVTHFRLH